MLEKWEIGVCPSGVSLMVSAGQLEQTAAFDLYNTHLAVHNFFWLSRCITTLPLQHMWPSAYIDPGRLAGSRTFSNLSCSA